MFEKIKVIELASVLAGPSVGQFFAEIGAEVIKVENPKSGGDVTRSWLIKDEQTKPSQSAYFSSVNWGKKSILLNLQIKNDLNKLYQLVEQCDIIITSYKAGDDKKLGVDYDTLKNFKKDLIYGQITGYGPDDSRVGYDAVIQAESGFMSINGEKDGDPLKMPIALVDILAAHQLKEGLLLAMINKMNTGEGSYVPVSLLDAAVSSLANQGSNWLVANALPKRIGNEHPNIAPYGDVFETKDHKKIILAIGNNKQFDSLCDILKTDLCKQEIFSSNLLRVKNRGQLNQKLKEQIGQKMGNALMLEMNANKVPAGFVKNIEEVFEQAPEAWFNVYGNLRGVKNFVGRPDYLKNLKLSPPPELGQHTSEILGKS